MPVDEMKIFFHQTLVAMSDTFHRATGDEKDRYHERFFEYFAKIRIEVRLIFLKNPSLILSFGMFFYIIRV
jgi:hypothetical protein